MKKWEYECKYFAEVRELIHDGDRSPRTCLSVMQAIEECCDELTPDDRKEWLWYDAFRDMKTEIHEEIEYMDNDDYESCEHTANYYLNEFYDLCDVANVWLSF